MYFAYDVGIISSYSNRIYSIESIPNGMCTAALIFMEGRRLYTPGMGAVFRSGRTPPLNVPCCYCRWKCVVVVQSFIYCT